MARKRRVCFVSGTRAEFGLMRAVLRAIQAHPRLQLQLAVTGMHLDRAHGRSIDAIRSEGWTIDATVPWPRGEAPDDNARNTGAAMAGLADTFRKLDSDIVLVVGDRVEAFAAAAAGHVAGRVVAHVHGGDRALGQVDDSLRHAITKLAHLHFPATAGSAERIIRLGEDAWRVHRVGSPGIDGIRSEVASRSEVKELEPDLTPHRYALVLLHPVDADPRVEWVRAQDVLTATRRGGVVRVVVIGPNNDPGSAGIRDHWQTRPRGVGVTYHADVPRSVFLGLLRDAGVLVGNSSSGIIEAASFGTPVVNVGPRQEGRERSGNVTDVPYKLASIRRAVAAVFNGGRPRRWKGRNVYGGNGAGRRVAAALAELSDDRRLLRKLIAY